MFGTTRALGEALQPIVCVAKLSGGPKIVYPDFYFAVGTNTAMQPNRQVRWRENTKNKKNYYWCHSAVGKTSIKMKEL